MPEEGGEAKERGDMLQLQHKMWTIRDVGYPESHL